MIWYVMIWYDTLLFDMIWYDVIWYDMILYKKIVKTLNIIPLQEKKNKDIKRREKTAGRNKEIKIKKDWKNILPANLKLFSELDEDPLRPWIS